MTGPSTFGGGLLFGTDNGDGIVYDPLNRLDLIQNEYLSFNRQQQRLFSAHRLMARYFLIPFYDESGKKQAKQCTLKSVKPLKRASKSPIGVSF